MAAPITVVPKDREQLHELISQQRGQRLAHRIGTTRQTLIDVSTKPSRSITIELATRIEAALGYDVGDLFTVPGLDTPEVRPYLPRQEAA